ncbi:MAG: serine/threonine-protein phosphatase, partial [Actinomycetota bacterium]|nr:serine/threonine-protein phosphatase [Actinomycetota bacterium]
MVKAGHPPLLVIDPEVRAAYCGRGAEFRCSPTFSAIDTSVTRTLAAGSIALVYTNGVVERRGESIDDGLERCGPQR